MDCTGCCMLVREDRACAAPAASEQACRGRCAMFECLYRGMSRFDSSPMTPDLFDYVPPTPGQEVQRTPTTAKVPVPELSSLSDASLAQLLADLTAELQRRRSGKAGQTARPELDRAIQEGLRTLETSIRQPDRRAKGATRAESAPSLQEAKRKAVRAAL